MIIHRMWIEFKGSTEWVRNGYYLFGFIPLYLSDSSPRKRIRK